jgi:hypothetical protein
MMPEQLFSVASISVLFFLVNADMAGDQKKIKNE